MTTDQEMTLDGQAIDSPTLQAELEFQRRRAERAEARSDSLNADLLIIGRKLREEAIRRDWCAEYGGFVDEVNDATTGEWLQHCEFPYVATFTVVVPFSSRMRSYTDATEEIRGYLGGMEELDTGSITGDITVSLMRCDEQDLD